MKLFEAIKNMSTDEFANWMASGNCTCLSCAYRNTHDNKIDCSRFSSCVEGYKLMLNMDLDEISKINDSMNILEFLKGDKNGFKM